MFLEKVQANSDNSGLGMTLLSVAIDTHDCTDVGRSRATRDHNNGCMSCNVVVHSHEASGSFQVFCWNPKTWVEGGRKKQLVL